jgi:hypothetical protein
MLLSKSRPCRSDFPFQDAVNYCVRQNEQAVVLVIDASVSTSVRANDPETGTLWKTDRLSFASTLF